MNFIATRVQGYIVADIKASIKDLYNCLKAHDSFFLASLRVIAEHITNLLDKDGHLSAQAR